MVAPAPKAACVDRDGEDDHRDRDNAPEYVHEHVAVFVG